MTPPPKTQALLTILFLAACGPSPTAQATIITSPGTPPVITPSLSPAFTPTHSPEPVVREGPFQLVAPIPSETVQLLGGDIRLMHLAGQTLLLGERALLRLAGMGWEPLIEDFPGAPAGIDRAGRLWVIPEAGSSVAVWENERWVMYAAESGWEPLAEPHATLATDPAGGIWLATGQDVRVFDGDLWTIFPPSRMGMRLAGGDTMSAFSLEFASATETVWVGECDLVGPGPIGGGGVRWWDGGRWLRGPSNDLGGCVLAVAESPNGEIWTGIDERLWRYDPPDRAWTEVDLPMLGEVDRPGPFVLDLAFGPTGDLWALVTVCGGASCSGNEILIRWGDNEWVPIGEPGTFLSAPTFDGRGAAWLPTSSGIYRVEDPGTAMAADLQAISAALDDEGRLWLAALKGGQAGLWADTGR